MKRMMLLLAMTLTTIAGTGIATAETATADTPFRFDLAQTDSHRGLGVEGYVYNGLPWRISNVRLRVESIDANGAVTASASGWVVGDVKAGGRAYFYVPVPTPAKTYRASVHQAGSSSCKIRARSESPPGALECSCATACRPTDRDLRSP